MNFKNCLNSQVFLRISKVPRIIIRSIFIISIPIIIFFLLFMRYFVLKYTAKRLKNSQKFTFFTNFEILSHEFSTHALATNILFIIKHTYSIQVNK